MYDYLGRIVAKYRVTPQCRKSSPWASDHGFLDSSLLSEGVEARIHGYKMRLGPRLRIAVDPFNVFHQFIQPQY